MRTLVRSSMFASLLPALLLPSLVQANDYVFLTVSHAFYLQFTPLKNGFGPQGRSALLDALESFELTFKESWPSSDFGISFDTPFCVGVGCSNLPVPSQFPSSSSEERSIVQRVSFFISSIEADYLALDDWSRAAFANNSFAPFLLGKNDTDPDGIFRDVDRVEYLSQDEFTSEYTFISNRRFLGRELHLEIGPSAEENDGYNHWVGGDIADKLDEFFEHSVVEKIADALEDMNGGLLYGSESPYLGGHYFSVGDYYLSGGIVDQNVTDKPSLVTTYNYGFELNYWEPKNATGQDFSWISNVVNSAFDDNAFLLYLLELHLTEYTFVNAWDSFDSQFKPETNQTGVVDVPSNATFPTGSPTTYRMYTTGGCIGRNELGTQYNSNVQECSKLCTEDSECVSFKFQSGTSTCLLSSSCSDLSMTVQDPGDSYDWFLKLEDDKYDDIDVNGLEEDTAFYLLDTTYFCASHYNLGNETGSNVRQCALLCTDDPQCVSFLFEFRTAKCTMASLCEEYSYDKDPELKMEWFLKVEY